MMPTKMRRYVRRQILLTSAVLFFIGFIMYSWTSDFWTEFSIDRTPFEASQLMLASNDDDGDEKSMNQIRSRSIRRTFCNGGKLAFSDAELENLLWTVYRNVSRTAPVAGRVNSVRKEIAKAVTLSKDPLLRISGLNSFHCSSRRDQHLPNETKTVLLWSERKFKNLKEWTDNIDSCRTGRYKCQYTFDKHLAQSSDAIVFHEVGMITEVKAFLRNGPSGPRTPDQPWIVYGKESPFNSFSGRELPSFDSVFNYTAHYSSVSDISVQYGECRHVTTLAADWPITSVSVQLLPIIFQQWEQQKPNFAATKTKLVAWFVSNCKTASKRRPYARQLAKFVQVDEYGKCGEQKTPTCTHQVKCDTTLNDYKFYLAFENSLCRDYATEKVYKVMLPEIATVPIVLGAASYETLLPPRSYIDILDFASAQELAKYLQYLDRNDTAYNEYFEWRRQYACRLVLPPCVLCDALHEIGTKKLNANMSNVFGKRKNCLPTQQYYSQAKSKHQIV